MEKAMFGAGCFWGVESAFRQIPGVQDVACGYSGGRLAHPSYQDVCYKDTGHAEVVLVDFNPQQVSYEALVDFFFQMHDPTTLNRQGPDVGDQYRSAIFYYSPEQARTAQAAKERWDRSGVYSRPIVTQIEAAREFWRAEEYHQQYFARRGMQPTCHVARKP
ncbi:MAG: peptide-methionine (S)-S-oxide reductase MsrA [Candidatus Hydrogenedentes bacterium]|nr:peptide-methionine (S)-S-oxide reductase MsrA [Candidatus Hydrogenedentota bacterium]MBI3119756.1 peptide-methionine (S)-S-oxide reductase MsrA [Candidatus Hydrogenedentota bacterium]